MTRQLATAIVFFVVLLFTVDARPEDEPPEVERTKEAIDERQAECLADYRADGVDPGDFDLEDICEYRAWKPLMLRWPDLATEAVKAEARANDNAGRLNECRHELDRCRARGEQLAEQVGQMEAGPTRWRAAAFGIGSGVVGVGLGIVVGVVIAK